MPRYRQPYSLTRIGNFIYYRTYDERGKRTSPKSTGCRTKGEAHQHMAELIRQGKLVPRKSYTLRQWAEERHWWDWQRCAYIRGRLNRAGSDKPPITERYAHDAKRKLEKHVYPTFADTKLDEITPAAIEEWQDDLHAKWTRATVVNITSVLSVMLHEAWRQDLIAEDPFERVRPVTVDHRQRGILTVGEAKRVLEPERWKNPIYWSMSMVAAACGMRQGEVLAVRTETLHPDHIVVDRSWHIKYGLTPTKNKRARVVPLPRSVYDGIRSWLGWDGFVFSMSSGERPVTGNRATDALKAAMESCGIDWRARSIGYHSWRHFANTLLRQAGVPEAELRLVTGHQSEAMSDHYTHYEPSDFKAVAEAQKGLLG